jgi:hypothetical protein
MKRIRAFQAIGDIMALICAVVTAGMGYLGLSWPAFIQIGMWTALILLVIGIATFLAISIKLVLLAIGSKD